MGLLGMAAGAQLVLVGREGIAADAGVREGFVALTVVAIGTSLPELVTAVQAARRHHPDLIVGKMLGSNAFNSLAAGGLIALIAPRAVSDPNLPALALFTMVGTALLMWLFLKTYRRLARWEAALLLGAYLAVLPLLAR
jgi:cation:H+ antiporter